MRAAIRACFRCRHTTAITNNAQHRNTKKAAAAAITIQALNVRIWTVGVLETEAAEPGPGRTSREGGGSGTTGRGRGTGVAQLGCAAPPHGLRSTRSDGGGHGAPFPMDMEAVCSRYNPSPPHSSEQSTSTHALLSQSKPLITSALVGSAQGDGAVQGVKVTAGRQGEPLGVRNADEDEEPDDGMRSPQPTGT